MVMAKQKMTNQKNGKNKTSNCQKKNKTKTNAALWRQSPYYTPKIIIDWIYLWLK